jgi:putative glycerol-1-phosphate prenyltransferase
MGKQLIYLEAGSGARNPVQLFFDKKVSENLTIPLLVGGGIRTKLQLKPAEMAGLDVVVIETFERNNEILDNVIN